MHLASISSQEENDKLEKHIRDFGEYCLLSHINFESRFLLIKKCFFSIPTKILQSFADFNAKVH